MTMPNNVIPYEFGMTMQGIVMPSLIRYDKQNNVMPAEMEPSRGGMTMYMIVIPCPKSI